MTEFDKSVDSGHLSTQLALALVPRKEGGIPHVRSASRRQNDSRSRVWSGAEFDAARIESCGRNNLSPSNPPKLECTQPKLCLENLLSLAIIDRNPSRGG
jgi:hypothetical protein